MKLKKIILLKVKLLNLLKQIGLPIIAIKDVVKITRLIEEGELEETKEILMLQDNNGWKVAHYLAGSSSVTGWATNDKEILELRYDDGWSIAHELAKYHPTWRTDDEDILSLRDSFGKTVRNILKRKGKI